MNTYEKKQIFKERLFKHILELDYESLQDLVAEGNPYGHLNMRYKLPININIDRIHTRREVGHDGWFNGSSTHLDCHNRTPLSIVWEWIREIWWDQEHNETKCGVEEFILPNGLCWGNHCSHWIDGTPKLTDILRNIFMILYKEYCKFNVRLDKWFLSFGGHLELYTVEGILRERGSGFERYPECEKVKTPISFIMWAYSEEEEEEIKNLEYFKKNILNFPKDTPWTKEHYTMMLVCHRNLFNEFIDKYSLTKKMATILLKKLIKPGRTDSSPDGLTDDCNNKDVDIWENLLKYGANEEEPNIYPETPFMKKMWKLRCVRLEPARWTSIEDFDDISAEELREMYYGNPKFLPLEFDE